jgi:hypothetical protein
MSETLDAPVELRFIDLFLLIIAALVFVTLCVAAGGTGADPRPRIVTAAVPAALRESAYELPLAGTGGTPPLAWRVVAGRLPDGVELRDGVLRGRTDRVGTHPFTVELLDAGGRTDRAALALTVLPLRAGPPEAPRALRVRGPVAALPDGRSGAAYEARLAVAGGTPPYRWTLAGGQLPPGLAVAEDGRIAGVPRVAPPPALPLLWRGDLVRRIRERRAGTVRFAVAVTDARGERAVQEAVVYVRPGPYPLGWRILLGDPPSSPLLRIILFCLLSAALAFIVFYAFFPPAMLLFGFPEQDVPGWRGVLRRPPARRTPPARGYDGEAWPPVGVPAVVLAVPARKVFNILAGIAGTGAFLFAAAWDRVRNGRAGGGSADGEDVGAAEPGGGIGEDGYPPGGARTSREPREEPDRHGKKQGLWRRLLDRLRRKRRGAGAELPPGRGGHPVVPFWTRGDGESGGGGGRPGGGDARQRGAPPAPREPVDEAYLESLRRGGRVRHGGAFLALPFLRRMGMEATVGRAFHPLPELGLGVLHATLEALFRELLGLRAPGGRGGPGLDPRFDVVLGRKGPAPPPPDPEGRPPPGGPRGGAQGDLSLPAWAPGDGGRLALEDAVRAAALEARRSLADALPGELAPARRARLLRRLLRGPAHVRLEDGVVRVRLRPPLRGRAALQALLDRLNAQDPRLPGRAGLPLRFVAEPFPSPTPEPDDAPSHPAPV